MATHSQQQQQHQQREAKKRNNKISTEVMTLFYCRKTNRALRVCSERDVETHSLSLSLSALAFIKLKVFIF